MIITLVALAEFVGMTRNGDTGTSYLQENVGKSVGIVLGQAKG